MNFENGDESEDDINCVLWVGNLDSKATEGNIFELFYQAGAGPPIKSIRIPKGADSQSHKGYCFIHFFHNSSVPYTINAMQGVTLFGKKLRLQPRPGSIHRKMMDQKKAEEQQQQQQAMAQWFTTVPPNYPQLAQIQNMVIYQNHLFPPQYANSQNVNIPVAYQAATTPQQQILAMQMQQGHAGSPTTAAAAAATQRQTVVPSAASVRAQSQPQQIQLQQQQITGYYASMPVIMPNHRPSNPSYISSQYVQANFLQQLQLQQQQQQQQATRGPRPRHNNNNGNPRLNFTPRGNPVQAVQMQQQQIFFNPMYQQAGPPLTIQEPNESQFFRRNQPQGALTSAPQPGVTPVLQLNGYHQNPQVYHY